MNRIPLLDMCARIEGHDVQHRLLRQQCGEVSDWKHLIARAELEGMGPLVKKHLEESGCPVPVHARRSLTMLLRRHQREAEVRSDVLREILKTLGEHDLTPILIKGAALAVTTYPCPSLRPMRDIDLLLRHSDVDAAQQLMREMGFVQPNAPIPPGHYHLPSLSRNVEGVPICIELHRGIYPDCPPWYPGIDFDRLLASAKHIELEDREVATLGDLDTLDYLYQHGFRAPLTYETYRLINAADLIGFVEKNCHELDFGQIRTRYPSLYRALPFMHYLTPWDESIVEDSFAIPPSGPTMLPLPFSGWPQRRLKRFQADGQKIHHILASTFLPPRWWLSIYYGATSPLQRLGCLCWAHPRHVLWWARLLFSVAREKERRSDGVG